MAKETLTRKVERLEDEKSLLRRELSGAQQQIEELVGALNAREKLLVSLGDLDEYRRTHLAERLAESNAQAEHARRTSAELSLAQNKEAGGHAHGEPPMGPEDVSEDDGVGGAGGDADIPSGESERDASESTKED